MPKKPRKTRKWKKPSDNPLNNIDFKSYYEETKEKEKIKGDSYKKLQKEYERILHKEIKKQHKAYRVVFKDHPDLLYIAFCGSRGSARWQACKYFKSIFNPFFSGEDANREMLKCEAYRVQELDKYALKGSAPIPALLHALDLSLPCSICGKDHFDYSDYEKGRCFIIEGEGNLNPYTSGYILCYDCHKKYIKNSSK